MLRNQYMECLVQKHADILLSSTQDELYSFAEKNGFTMKRKTFRKYVNALKTINIDYCEDETETVAYEKLSFTVTLHTSLESIVLATLATENIPPDTSLDDIKTSYATVLDSIRENFAEKHKLAIPPDCTEFCLPIYFSDEFDDDTVEIDLYYNKQSGEIAILIVCEPIIFTYIEDILYLIKITINQLQAPKITDTLVKNISDSIYDCIGEHNQETQEERLFTIGKFWE